MKISASSQKHLSQTLNSMKKAVRNGRTVSFEHLLQSTKFRAFFCSLKHDMDLISLPGKKEELLDDLVKFITQMVHLLSCSYHRVG